MVNLYPCRVKKFFNIYVPERLLPKTGEATELGELKVEGRTRYIEENQTTFIPTKKEKKISHGGIELIRTMALADLYVDPHDQECHYRLR